MNDISLEKKVIETIDKSGDLERLKFHLDKITDSNVVLILFSPPETKQPITALIKKIDKISKEYEIKIKINHDYIQEIQKKIKKSSRIKRWQEIRYKFTPNGWVYPLIHGSIIYGYLCVIVEKASLAREILNFIDDYLSICLEKALKEIELIKVHGSLRPRAIALSTVHTVHRLISSTLNMDELLPRLARLCLQVTRSKVCIIYLKRGKFLKPEAIASTNSHPKVGKISILKNLGRALEEGGVIFTSKNLFVPLIEEELIGAICLREKLSGKPFDLNDKEILSVLAEQAIVAIKNAQLYETQGKILMESLQSLSKILEVRSPKTYTHPESFLALVLAIAEEYGVSQEEREQIKYATLLLDTGKIAIPENILVKPTKLTQKEYRFIIEHPLKSAEIVKSIKSLKPVLPIIMYHHERYDGKGYPKGLKGERIPLGARILAVADAFEAMICQRPYKKSLNFQQAVSEIEKNSAKQFDPKVVEAFLSAIKKSKIKKIAYKMLTEVKKG